jgi:aminomethyltransferase
LFLNPNAGIIDDTIITNFPEKKEVKLVVNGANKHKVMQHFMNVKAKETFNVNFILDDSRSLICIQGPKAASVVEAVLGFPTQDIPFMSQFEFTNHTYTIPLFVSRSGYTGEDGFEISFDNKYVNTIVNAFLQQP